MKEHVCTVLEEEGISAQGIAEMYIGTMHGYALELLRRLAPETFKFSVLTEITARLFIESQQSKVGTMPGSVPRHATP